MMLQGAAKKMLDEALEQLIQDEVERRMKDLSTHVVIDGELVDSDVCDISGGEIYVEIQTPIYFSETGAKGFVEKEHVNRRAS